MTRLLASRPVLREVLVADDPLLGWARARFGGAGADRATDPFELPALRATES